MTTDRASFDTLYIIKHEPSPGNRSATRLRLLLILYRSLSFSLIPSPNHHGYRGQHTDACDCPRNNLYDLYLMALRESSCNLTFELRKSICDAFICAFYIPICLMDQYAGHDPKDSGDDKEDLVKTVRQDSEMQEERRTVCSVLCMCLTHQ